MKKLVVIVLVGLGLASVNAPSYAGVPLNNLEGVGGIAFNPLAYTAGTKTEEPNHHGKFSLDEVFTSKPQIGTWYVNLCKALRNASIVNIKRDVAGVQP